MKKMTTQTTKSGLKLKLDRETIRSLQNAELQQAAGGSTYRCHSGLSITYCGC